MDSTNNTKDKKLRKLSKSKESKEIQQLNVRPDFEWILDLKKKKKGSLNITGTIWLFLVFRSMLQHIGVRGLDVYNLHSNDSSNNIHVYIHI